MTPEQAAQKLAVVSRKLEQVRQQLIRCEPPDVQVTPLLQQVVELLHLLQDERKLLACDPAVQQLLADIQARTERVSILLHAAENLVCHSTLEQPQVEGFYTPDGKLPVLEFNGRMVVHL